MPEGLSVLPVPGLPEVVPGDDLAALIVSRVTAAGLDVVDGDVLVVSSKVASKSLGLVAADRETAVRAATRRVVAERSIDGGRVTRVVESAAGPVMAAAGVDASNTGALDGVLLLPEDPDGVCASLLGRLQAAFEVQRLAVVLSDTSGRPWRMGQVDFALGAAGLCVVDDLRGVSDADGRTLSVTTRAVADEVAAAADLVKGKAAGVPVALVRGVAEFVTGSFGEDGGRSLVRTGPEDWFVTGAAEAVRAALGVAPGSELAEHVGIPSISDEPVAARVRRGVAVALAARELDDGVGVDVGTDAVVVTGGDPVDRGIVAARIGVALWGEGFASSIEPAAQRGSDSVRVLVLAR
ncbi:MAG TPA: coenzyme F420-0:L-glutamate ligase [Lapillicoccus sp.]|nr:coenzyme F420-0:L-glutamate ligase [Lapillicoccus sp.]